MQDNYLTWRRYQLYRVDYARRYNPMAERLIVCPIVLLTAYSHLSEDIGA